MSKFYPELRDIGQIRGRNKYRRYWCKYEILSSVSHRANLSASSENCEMRWCWTRVTQTVSEGSKRQHPQFNSRHFLCDAKWWDTCVTPDTCGVMQTSWHPPTVSGGSQEASCKFIFMFLLPSTAPPGQVTDQMHAGLELEANGTVTGAGTLRVFCKAPLTLHQSIISNEHG